jgi:hypothetical protein
VSTGGGKESAKTSTDLYANLYGKPAKYHSPRIKGIPAHFII